MVASDPAPGLIATVQAAATPILDDVAASCGWPVLLEATPRRVQRELAATNPECVLFWLDDLLAIDATARLIAWARQRGARPLRMAAALDASDAVESALRAAGAHSFLSVSSRTAGAIAAALSPLLAGAARTPAEQRRADRGQVAATGSFFADHVRPP